MVRYPASWSTSQSASESFPPETAISTASSRASIRQRRTVSSTWCRKKSTKSDAQKAVLWRRSSSTARPPHFRHFIAGPPR